MTVFEPLYPSLDLVEAIINLLEEELDVIFLQVSDSLQLISEVLDVLLICNAALLLSKIIVRGASQTRILATKAYFIV